MITRMFGAALVILVFHCSLAERFFNDQTELESHLTRAAILILYMSLWILVGAIGYYGPGLWLARAVGRFCKQQEYADFYPITGFKVYHYVPFDQLGNTPFPIMSTWYEYWGDTGSDEPHTLTELQAMLEFEAPYDCDMLVIRTYSLSNVWMDWIAVPKKFTSTFALVGKPQDIEHVMLPEDVALAIS